MNCHMEDGPTCFAFEKTVGHSILDYKQHSHADFKDPSKFGVLWVQAKTYAEKNFTDLRTLSDDKDGSGVGVEAMALNQ